MTRQHIVFLTGAGISVDSGLSTFRGKDGLWTNEEWAYLASTEALYNDTQRCLDFYNWRRKQLSEVEPNDAHHMIAELEKEHEVTVITQNVDNLHERAGSTHVIHLHGELSKVCSMNNRTTCVKEYPLTTPIMVGDKAEDGSQLRPYIVMFGEYVDGMNVAIDIVSKADIFVVIGTSLKVYPAAGFINYAHHEVPKFVIDPGEMDQCTHLGFTHFKTTATEGSWRHSRNCNIWRIMTKKVGTKVCLSGGEHGGHPAETPETCRLEQGASPCAATSQERQSALSD